MSAAVMMQLPQMPPQLNGEVPSLPDKLHSVDMGRYEQVPVSPLPAAVMLTAYSSADPSG